MTIAIPKAKLTLEWEDDETFYSLAGYIKEPSFDLKQEYIDVWDSARVMRSDTQARLYWVEFLPNEEDDRLAIMRAKRKFTEIREVKIVVPSLTAENIALAAAQAGLGDMEEFAVEPYAGQFILTFKSELVIHDDFEGGGKDG